MRIFVVSRISYYSIDPFFHSLPLRGIFLLDNPY